MLHIIAAKAPVSSHFSATLVKLMLSFFDQAHRIADAHDARGRFANLRDHHLEDIGLTAADRDYRIKR